jgi:FemAB-related protein (PEP-CTERM system-associated)
MIEVNEKPDGTLVREVDDYLARATSKGVSGEHDARWLRVLCDAMKHRPIALLSRPAAGQPLDGYLPLALVRSKLFGRFLVSLPYINHAGVLAESDDIADALIARAAELAQQYDVEYLELRHGHPRTHAVLTAQRDDKVLMVAPLPGDADALWNSLHSKVRNQIRKADKGDLTAKWGSADLLDDFYDVFAINMRDLGTPVYSKQLFASILATFGNRAELICVYLSDQPIAGALLMHHPTLGSGDAAEPATSSVPSASSLREFNSTNANMWMYHRMLNRAIERGSALFDFGRSSEDSGTYRFKKQWGAEPRPTVWQYHVRRGDINAVRPDSPKYRRRIETWQKLPVWLTRVVGPSIVRGIP